jgi:hypothetical protein
VCGAGGGAAAAPTSGTWPRRCAASLEQPARGPGRCAVTPGEGRERGATAARPPLDSPARGTEGERAAGVPPAGSAVASEETEREDGESSFFSFFFKWGAA